MYVSMKHSSEVRNSKYASAQNFYFITNKFDNVGLDNI
jgi:hypothetical protein